MPLGGERRVPYEEPNLVSVLPSRWVADYDGEAAGSIDLTPRGRYRVTNRHGSVVGTFRGLADARDRLIESNSATRLESLNRSRTLIFVGLSLLLATAALATWGMSVLLTS